VTVTNADGQNATLINGFTVTEDLGNTVKLGSGFTVGALVLNGNAQLNGSVLELTDNNLNEDSSAWYATRVNVQNFATDFTFHLSPGVTADGFTFALQSNSTAALGIFGGGMGFGPVDAGDPGGIPNSIAVKFDLFDNVGEGINSTGLFINGAAPNIPSVDLTPSGIDLHSGDVFAAHITYDGTTLTLTLTDTVTNAVFTNSWPIDIPATVGAPTAYAGFTGGTGGLAVAADILTWTLGPLAPAVTFSPVGPVNFPDTTVNTTSPPTAITITNSGSATLHITAVALTGTNLSDFTAASDTCTGTTVAPNATCAVGVTFKPSGTGPRQANLEVTDDASGSPQSLALAGNGLAPATPGVTFTPATLVTFPNTTINTTSPATTITITNSGNATLNITTATLSGTNAADFAAATNTCNGASLAANATCTVGVTFTPSAVGLRQATLQVADNAPASPQSLTLNGTGTSANSSAVTITPASLSFTSTQGVTTAPMNLTVTNSGTAPLHVTGVTFSGPDVAEFVNPASACTAAIAPSASCTIAVRFAPVSPMSANNKTETILIADDASNSPQSVTVTGTINASAFTVTNASSLTATVTAGQTATYNVQLTPGPGFSGTVTMACSGAPAGAACTVANPITLTSGTPTTFAVSVTTTARSFLVPTSNRQPLVPSAPYLLLFTGLCVAMLALFYQHKVRGLTQRQLAYSTGLLVLVLVGAGLAGCASSGSGSSGGGGNPSSGTQKGTYTLTLTPTTTNTGGKTVQVPAQSLTLIVN
jgi:Legume lectin domain